MHQKVNAVKEKSLILTGKKNNNNNKIRKKARARNTGIILLGHTPSIDLAKFTALHLFGDRIRSSDLFMVTSRTRITDDFINVFNSITSLYVFRFVAAFNARGFNIIFSMSSEKTQIATVYIQSIFQVQWLIATSINEVKLPSFIYLYAGT